MPVFGFENSAACEAYSEIAEFMGHLYDPPIGRLLNCVGRFHNLMPHAFNKGKAHKEL
jgi:hypothetical protein